MASATAGDAMVQTAAQLLRDADCEIVEGAGHDFGPTKAISGEEVGQECRPPSQTQWTAIASPETPVIDPRTANTHEPGPCLHADEHLQPCCLCACPPAEDPSHYELVGEVGKRNGGKLLRAKILALPQWTEPAARLDTARTAIQLGCFRVAQALVDARSADLQKDDLLILARLWGLRSYLWRYRGPKLGSSRPTPHSQNTGAAPSLAGRPPAQWQPLATGAVEGRRPPPPHAGFAASLAPPAPAVLLLPRTAMPPLAMAPTAAAVAYPAVLQQMPQWRGPPVVVGQSLPPVYLHPSEQHRLFFAAHHQQHQQHQQQAGGRPEAILPHHHTDQAARNQEILFWQQEGLRREASQRLHEQQRRQEEAQRQHRRLCEQEQMRQQQQQQQQHMRRLQQLQTLNLLEALAGSDGDDDDYDGGSFFGGDGETAEGEVEQACHFFAKVAGNTIGGGGAEATGDTEIEVISRPAKAPRTAFFGSSPGLHVRESAAAPFMERTAVHFRADPNTMLAAMKANVISRMHAAAERLYQAQQEARVRRGEALLRQLVFARGLGGSRLMQLLAVHGNGFITDETLAAIEGTLKQTVKIVGMSEQIRLKTIQRLTHVQAAGPPEARLDGASAAAAAAAEPRLTEDDLAGVRLARLIYNTFLDMKDEALRLQGLRPAPISEAQRAWEAAFLRNCLSQMELLSLALSANAQARRDTSDKESYTAYLMIVDQLNVFFCNHNARMAATLRLRKAWIEDIIRSRQPPPAASIEAPPPQAEQPQEASGAASQRLPSSAFGAASSVQSPTGSCISRGSISEASTTDAVTEPLAMFLSVGSALSDSLLPSTPPGSPQREAGAAPSEDDWRSGNWGRRHGVLFPPTQ